MFEASFHPVPKPSRKKATSQKRLKRAIHPIPIEIKRKALEKSALCFAGHCPVCGGLSVTIADDPHHYPRKGSHGGRDLPEHLWMCKRICHSYMHDHPLVEKEMFQRIEAAGYFVDWGAKKLGKKI